MTTIPFKILLLVFITMGSTVIAQPITFTNYTTADGLPDNFINGGVAIDKNNNKWFGTVAGVAKFDNVNWTVYTIANGLPDNYINCISVDNDNNIWVGLDGFGVCKFNGTIWTTYTTADGLVDNSVYNIAAGKDGSVWFATYSGASRLKNSIWTTYTTADGLPIDVISVITPDEFGNVWFGTWGGGVSKYNGTNFTNFDETENLIDTNISAISIEENGTKWFGTLNLGVSVFNNSDIWVNNYTMTSGLPENYIRDIKFDSYGNVWIGIFVDYLFDGYISKFDGTDWTSYTVEDGLVHDQIKNMAVDQDDNIWVATGGGVSKISLVTGVNETNMNAELSVFPNPSKDFLSINLNNNYDKGIKVIEFYNIMNQKIAGYPLDENSNQIKISLQDYSNGIYFVRMGNICKKVVIQK